MLLPFAFFSMETFTLSLVLALLLGVGALGMVAYVIALWRHKRAGSGEVSLLGCVATVETPLAPEGYVLVRGELWPARAVAGEKIARGQAVRVCGARGHLLEVEPLR